MTGALTLEEDEEGEEVVSAVVALEDSVVADLEVVLDAALTDVSLALETEGRLIAAANVAVVCVVASVICSTSVFRNDAKVSGKPTVKLSFDRPHE